MAVDSDDGYGALWTPDAAMRMLLHVRVIQAVLRAWAVGL